MAAKKRMGSSPFAVVSNAKVGIVVLEAFLVCVYSWPGDVIRASTERRNENNRYALSNRCIPIGCAVLNVVWEEAWSKPRKNREPNPRALQPVAGHDYTFYCALLEGDFKAIGIMRAHLEVRIFEIVVRK